VHADLFLGIDIGSTTVKVVVLDASGALLGARYVRSQGQPRQALLRVVEELGREFDLSGVAGVGLTGSGGEPIARMIGGRHVNELIAQTEAVGKFHPEARTVIEIGGQDSKFLSVAWDDGLQRMVLADFAMNSLCAAGTGSFLDQQAERLGLDIETEFPALAVQSTSPARIAGRCTVFAKSDMIHLQQKGTPLPDIIAGLCLALARNFKSVVAKGKPFVPPTLFQGGVAYNQGVVRAFETVLELPPGALVVPEHHTLMAALGTGFIAMQEAATGGLPRFIGFEPLSDYVRTGQHERKSLPPLGRDALHEARCDVLVAGGASPAPEPVYVGIDVGSISTNVVLIDERAQVLARRYLMTAGRPLEAVRQGLAEVGQEAGARVVVRGVGVTGSGRYLTGDFVGADVVRNEITAQARAAVAIDPSVDTVFEIGGQDSKYISLNNGAVVDFAMNNACAAGTGSFLEEQADRLEIDIKTDFSRLALAAERPACLGERCTVFMESDLVHHQQQGAALDELTGGLAYAIAQNYVNRVVNRRPIGRNVFFQGGVAWNQSVVAAFQNLLGRRVTVPPHHDVTGAIGVAILALEHDTEQRRAGRAVPSRFKGFHLADRHYESSSFECRACPNLCEISRVVIGGDPPIFYGARCDKFEEAGRRDASGSETALPDLFAEREALLLDGYTPPGSRNGRLRVAFPRALIFYELFPYWRTLFEHLGAEVLVTQPTNRDIAARSAEYAAVETCFPVKLMFGHVLDSLEQDADFVFLPSVPNRENVAPGVPENNYCTFVPAAPHLVTAHVAFPAGGPRPLKLAIHLQWPRIKRQQLRQLARTLGVSDRQMEGADAAAEAAQRDFSEALRRRGREILDWLPPEQVAIAIIGRPYNTCDPGACQDLPFKLRKLGVLPIPVDMLPVQDVDLTDRVESVFWRGAQSILSAARLIRTDPRLQAIYVTNFNCGPDSFLLSFFRRELGAKPFLELEFDDHTADAGVVTRCEAFLESLRMGRGKVA
jgi:predicted CoA-substrate-specific enzyme activase